MTAAPPFIVKGPRGVGYVPTIQADGSIQWAPAGSGGGGGAPSGPAGGDLAGTYPNPTIADAHVTPAKLSFDPATQPELDAEASARAAADAAHAAAADPHPGYRLESAPIAVGDLAFDPATQAELNAHEADTTAIHGIADTAALVLTGDARLSDARAPTAHKASHLAGGADAFVAGDLLDAVVKRLRESAGPTDLTLGAVADGQYLRRSGATVVGGTPAGGGGNPYAMQARSGSYITAAVQTYATLAPATNTLSAIPLFIPHDLTVDRIGCFFATAGTAGSVIRLGIYADDGTGFPGALILDVGTAAIDSGTNVDILITISQTFTTGLYWLAGVVQVAASGTMKVLNSPPLGISAAGVGNAHNLDYYSWAYNGVTGALPNPWGGTATHYNRPPAIWLRVV